MTIKKLIAGGQLDSFEEIFDTIPKSVVARDLGMNNVRFSKLINNMGRFMLEDLYRMAEYIEVDGSILVMLADKQFVANRKRKK